MLTDLQRRKISNVFAVHDYDRDGVLTKGDFEEYTRRIAATRGWAPGSAEYGRLLSRFIAFWEGLESGSDRSGDRRVSQEEWFAYWDRILQDDDLFDDLIRPIAENVFDTLDHRGDGVVTADEFALMYTSGALDAGAAAAAFERLDGNHDGHITRDEMSHLIAEFFKSSDPDAPANWLFGPM